MNCNSVAPIAKFKGFLSTYIVLVNCAVVTMPAKVISTSVVGSCGHEESGRYPRYRHSKRRSGTKFYGCYNDDLGPGSRVRMGPRSRTGSGA